jgi:hypothetical protein
MPPTLSTAVAVSMILSLVLGILTQIVQTGSLFGQFVAPKAWLPGFTLAATFLSGVVGYFGGLSPLVLTGSSIFYALMSGAANLLTGAIPGVAVHAHSVVPAQARAAKAQLK